MQVIFWCEFPGRVDWEEAKRILDFKTEIYVTVKTRKEYEEWKKKIGNKKIGVGAWPTLELGEGYWFSGFVDKKAIDKLKQFKNLKLKVDIEPPFPGGKFSPILLIKYFIPHIVRKGKNNSYLVETIKGLKGNVIISGFPLPEWITKRYGDVINLENNMEKNFISYTTLLPKTLSRWYVKRFAKKAIKKYREKAIFAVGCTGKGVFGNEKTYKGIDQFKEDLAMMKKIGAKKVVIFNIEGIMERKDRKEWIEAIKKFICG